MPEKFEKFTPKKELEKIEPTPVEKKKPIELTKEEDEHFIDLLKKAKEAEKKGDLDQAIKLYLQFKEEYQALREKKEGKQEGKMVKIEDFIDFVENNFPQPGPGEKYVWKEDWLKLLDEKVTGWRDLVKDKNNWDKIDKVKISKDFDKFCEALLEVVGTELASHWFDSDIEEQRKEARDWLEEISKNLLTPEIWKKLSPEAKEYIINYIFDWDPGEPYVSLRHIHHEFPFRGSITVSLPLLSYIPSAPILNLRRVIERAKDTKFLKVVDGRIREIKKGFSTLQTLRIPYTPTGDEIELIARVFDKFRRFDWGLSPLPQIFLSFETPPLFIAYPELEEGEDNERKNEKIPRNRQRPRPETISIEEVLGLYIPVNPHIILYQRGLKWFAKKFNLDEDFLRGIVLVHEIGHWITHLLPKKGIPEWNINLYKLTSNEVHEGWAQLITYWVVKEIGGEIEQIFEELNRRQSFAYQVYKNFIGIPVDKVIKSLEFLRFLNYPATIYDWEKFLK